MLTNTQATITLTPLAISAVRDIIQQRQLDGYALRVYVQGSGCCGVQYGMALDNKTYEQDVFFEFDGVKLVVDPVSLDYMRGTVIDFVDGPQGKGFAINNPNEVGGSCSCGGSGHSQNEAEGCGCGGGSCDCGGH